MTSRPQMNARGPLLPGSARGRLRVARAPLSGRIAALLLALLLGACASSRADVPRQPAATDQLSLRRGPCFGACPMYLVRVSGDGRVYFEGDRFVEHTGERSKTIDPRAAAELFALADSIGFFELPSDITPANQPACGDAWTDMPDAEISIQWGNRDHTVRHYHGCPKAPEALTAFERRIDEVLGVREWIGDR